MALRQNLVQDVRFALRQFRMQPGFSAIAVLVLALGFGANAAIFSVVNAVLLHPFAYPSASRLMLLFEKDVGRAGGGSNVVSFPNFADWQARLHSFHLIAAPFGLDMSRSGHGISPER